ncbi:hypothetical protein Pcinc_037698 [Petrolisthes cinctipes]|uniref:Uncharacterized protein n=1 Tax=Petrolisthes cinctipes TaxID=88211 RepID=A0AAE1EL41_PETCI|nr:hypothetical protein Pcinc_037698 [Petrolisthes cinctipes]
MMMIKLVERSCHLVLRLKQIPVITVGNHHSPWRRWITTPTSTPFPPHLHSPLPSLTTSTSHSLPSPHPPPLPSLTTPTSTLPSLPTSTLHSLPSPPPLSTPFFPHVPNSHSPPPLSTPFFPHLHSPLPSLPTSTLFPHPLHSLLPSLPSPPLRLVQNLCGAEPGGGGTSVGRCAITAEGNHSYETQETAVYRRGEEAFGSVL